jgi:hypothetical protein
MHRRQPLALLLAVPLVTLAACGGGSGGDSDKDQITQLINKAKSDPVSLCRNFSKAALKTIPGGEAACVKQVKASPPDPSAAKASSIKSITVTGDKAKAVNSTKTGDATAKFVKEDGHWKFDVP